MNYGNKYQLCYENFSIFTPWIFVVLNLNISKTIELEDMVPICFLTSKVCSFKWYPQNHKFSNPIFRDRKSDVI